MSFSKILRVSISLFVKGCLPASKLPLNHFAFSMSTLVDKRKGDEDAYFRREDQERKAALRASFEKLLESNDGNHDKQEVLEILGEQSNVEKLLNIGFIGSYLQPTQTTVQRSNHGSQKWG